MQQSSTRPSIEELEERIAILEARSAIRRLVTENERVADAGNLDGTPPPWSDLSAMPQPDEGTFQPRWSSKGGGFVGINMTEEGFGGFTDLTLADMAKMPPLSEWIPRAVHYLANEDIQVDLAAGTARALWYSFEPAVARLRGEWTPILIVGRNSQRFVHEDGGWRLTEIQLEEVFSVRYGAPNGWVGDDIHVPFGPRNAASFQGS